MCFFLFCPWENFHKFRNRTNCHAVFHFGWFIVARLSSSQPTDMCISLEFHVCNTKWNSHRNGTPANGHYILWWSRSINSLDFCRSLILLDTRTIVWPVFRKFVHRGQLFVSLRFFAGLSSSDFALFTVLRKVEPDNKTICIVTALLESVHYGIQDWLHSAIPVLVLEAHRCLFCEYSARQTF